MSEEKEEEEISIIEGKIRKRPINVGVMDQFARPIDRALNYIINPPVRASAHVEFTRSIDKSRSAHKEFWVSTTELIYLNFI